jgi:hypothetical protein
MIRRVDYQDAFIVKNGMYARACTHNNQEGISNRSWKVAHAAGGHLVVVVVAAASSSCLYFTFIVFYSVVDRLLIPPLLRPIGPSTSMTACALCDCARALSLPLRACRLCMPLPLPLPLPLPCVCLGSL